MTDPNTRLTHQQIQYLLQPIDPARVLGLKKGSATLSYVAQHDVRAHLTRIFGFGNWSMDVLNSEFLFEEQNESKRWVACYRATVRISIFTEDGFPLTSYTDCHASGCAPQPDRSEAHALALTTAVSTAMKRAATCLGDQFGLSLYNKGQKAAFVRGTLIGMEDPEVQVAPVTTIGDESDQETGETPEPLSSERPAQPLVDEQFLATLRAAINVADIADRLQLAIDLKQQASDLGYNDSSLVNSQGMTLGKVFDMISKGA